VRVRSRNGCASSPGHAHVAVRVDGRARSRRAPRRVVGRPPATATVGPDRTIFSWFCRDAGRMDRMNWFPGKNVSQRGASKAAGHGQYCLTFFSQVVLSG
jgi:hypothetical protein